MARQFVNMIVQDVGTTLYSLCRIDLSKHLLHPSTAAAKQAAAKAKAKMNKKWLSPDLCRNSLPCRPALTYQVPPRDCQLLAMLFFSQLRGIGESCILSSDFTGHATAYDADTDSVIAVPHANFRKDIDSITLSTTHRALDANLHEVDVYRLYVLAHTVDGFSEAFNHTKTATCVEPTPAGRRYNTHPPDVNWYWDPLPQLEPLNGNDYGKGKGNRYGDGTGNGIYGKKKRRLSAAAVIDDRTICVSSMDGVTYSFDVEDCEWTQLTAGSWVLPFRGAAEHVPELGLWFGIDATEHRLCALDLSGFSSSFGPPVVKHAWDYLHYVPGDEWSVSYQNLVNLGSGRFCIATAWARRDDNGRHMVDDEITVLTGVEVVRDHGDDGRLQMIRHRSKRYSIPNVELQCVL